MDCPRSCRQSKQEPRPCCPECGRPGWFDGWRVLKWQAKLGADGVLEWVGGLERRRAHCPNRECTVRSWTIYEEQGYPHRTFPPAVAVAAVAEFLFRGETALADVASRWGCSPRTLVRWLGWIGGIVELAVLIKVIWALDLTGMPPPTYRARQGPDVPGPAWKSRMALVGNLVLLFEKFARILRERDLPLEDGPGLGAILRLQFDQFRQISRISKLSPPLYLDWLWAGG